MEKNKKYLLIFIGTVVLVTMLILFYRIGKEVGKHLAQKEKSEQIVTR